MDIPSVIAGIEGVSRVTVEEGGRFTVESDSGLPDSGANIQEKIAETIVNKGWGLIELTPHTMSLEEVFLKLTTSEEGVATSEKGVSTSEENVKVEAE